MLYQALKDLIVAKSYEYNDMKKKLDLFLRGGKITQTQYDELMGIMNDHKAELEPVE